MTPPIEDFRMDRFDPFTIMPLSAGDIIDRAVRLYRRHFVALLRIVLAPSLIAYVGAIALTVGLQNFSPVHGDAQMIVSGLLVVGGLVIYLIGKIAFFVVLGGTSRALVNHFLDSSPLRAREVFRTVRERLWSLIGATLVVFLLLVALFSLVYVIVVLMVVIYTFSVVWLIQGLPPWMQITLHLIFGGLFAGLLVALFLTIYARVIYVPQALMVEGKGVFSALSRSFTLAGGNLRRIAAIILFWFYVASSVYLLLLIPLDWYAYLNGVDINPFSVEKPLWYSISQQTLTQVSEILLMPIALLGFTILYIDSRVRKEGFDIELFANRRLPAVNFTPSLVVSPSPASVSPVPSILGLNDYRPAPVEQAIIEEHRPTPDPSVERDPDSRACQSCGTPAGHDDRFCRRCGAVYAESVEVSG